MRYTGQRHTRKAGHIPGEPDIARWRLDRPSPKIICRRLVTYAPALLLCKILPRYVVEDDNREVTSDAE